MKKKETIIVACHGSFGYKIHEGHKKFLSFARQYGSRLFVFVTPDYVIERHKNRKPYYSQHIRARNLQNLDDVNAAIPMIGSIEVENQDQIVKFHPDIHVFGPDQCNEWDIGLREKLININVKLVEAPKNLKLFSTTQLLKGIGYI